MGKIITSGAPSICRLAPFRRPQVASIPFRHNAATLGPRRRATARSVTRTVRHWACDNSQAQL